LQGASPHARCIGELVFSSFPGQGDQLKLTNVKLFYTGPVINTEMLVLMLEKHGIIATQEFTDPDQPVDENDLNRLAKVFVPEKEYDRAYQLFYGEKEGEL
jgi:hypothetical protein